METTPMARSILAFTVTLGLMFPLLVHAAPGDLDPTFGVGGKVIGPLFVSPESFRAIDQVIQPDGRIVIVGFSTLDTWYTLTTVRLQTDGTLDPTFGSGGVVTAPLGDGHDLGLTVAFSSPARPSGASPTPSTTATWW
jgi:hypothetical protein